MKDTTRISTLVAEVANLSREELAVHWTKNHGCPPPLGIRRQLLTHSAAWHLQKKRLGGYDAETRRLLKIAKAEALQRLTGRTKDMVSGCISEMGKNDDVIVHDPDETAKHPDGSGGNFVSKRQRKSLQPGARLMREWNGKMHVVDVIEDGFVFEAKRYASLTAIAGKITGAHWSGPRFFGL